jgi:4-hydroxy-tetrahydrodipicolinate synthase
MSATPETMRIRQLRLMTAIKTPYKPDGNVDYPAFDRLCEHQIANGVEGLIIGGTTGEGHLLSWDEHLALIAHSKGKFGDRLAIVGNTGGNNTGEAAWATNKGFAAGMDASLLINPYYGKTSAKGVVRHIVQGGLEMGPAIIYNVAGRTGQDISPDIIAQLAPHPHFCGVKECSGHERIKLYSDQGIMCWSGNDDQCHESRHVHGGLGVISVTSNVVPGLMRDLMRERNDALNEKLSPLFKWLFTEPNPIGVNTLLMQLGAASPVFRLPYTHRSVEEREEVVKILTAVGLEHCPTGPGGLQVLLDDEFVHSLNGDA